MAREYSRSASKGVESTMRRKKKGKLKRGKGGRGGAQERKEGADA